MLRVSCGSAYHLLKQPGNHAAHGVTRNTYIKSIHEKRGRSSWQSSYDGLCVKGNNAVYSVRAPLGNIPNRVARPLPVGH